MTSKRWKEHHGPFIESKDGYEIIECSPCGFRHIIPIPSQKELDEIYRNEYYSVEKPLFIERNQEDQDWWKVVYDGRFDSFETLLPSSRRDILDIGSGPGFFLSHGRSRGWNCVGVEPSDKAARFSQGLGLDVKNEFLNEETAKTLGTFDVVYMNEVLEHLRDPLATIQIAENLINPGGLLCVVVPNDYNPFQQALQTACGFPSWWVAAPHHINYFNVETIETLLSRAGITIVTKEATFPIDLFLLMGVDYVGNDELGRRCHGRRKTFEINLEKAGLSNLKHSLYQSFAELGIGREIQVIGQKLF